jgi:hypothetical protein
MVALAMLAGFAMALLEISQEARAEEGPARIETGSVALSAKPAHKAEEYEMLRRLLELVPGPAPMAAGTTPSPASESGTAPAPKDPAS